MHEDARPSTLEAQTAMRHTRLHCNKIRLRSALHAPMYVRQSIFQHVIRNHRVPAAPARRALKCSYVVLLGMLACWWQSGFFVVVGHFMWYFRSGVCGCWWCRCTDRGTDVHPACSAQDTNRLMLQQPQQRHLSGCLRPCCCYGVAATGWPSVLQLVGSLCCGVSVESVLGGEVGVLGMIIHWHALPCPD